MSRIIFVPICENCGFKFTRLDLYKNFLIACPRCGELLNSAVIPNIDYIINDKNEELHFVYDEEEMLFGLLW